MKTQSSEQFVNIRLYDFIRVNPTAVTSIFADQKQNRLYVSRQTYSEVYEIATNATQPVLQQIAELQPSQYFLQIDGILALFKPFQLKLFRNERWEYHSFTTQLLSIRVINQTVYTFHEKETMLWHFSEDNFHYKYLNESSSPYHLDAEGTIVGFGKKVRIVNKAAKLTVCEVISNQWVFVGDDKGSLHVYDWKFLSHVKTFSEHQGPILAIKIDEESNSVYFTGSDSKIGMIRLVNEEWKLGVSVRGQSHDILGLERFGKYLISGGVTTDLCFYPLDQGELTTQFHHKVSYCSSNRVDTHNKFVVVNHRNYFQIWQLGNSLNRTELMIKYEMPGDKFIVDCKIYRESIEENTHLILVVTDQDTIGWRFNPELGLEKYITIENQYTLVELLTKHSFIGIRMDGLIERVNCKNGKIEQISYCEVNLPTDIRILGGGLVLVGSKISRSINIISTKSKDITKRFTFKNTYTYVDQFDSEQLIIQYFNNPILYKFNLQSEDETEWLKLPVSIIRFAGWLNSVTKHTDKQVKSKLKKYWYAISEGKVVIVPNLQSEGKKKIRTKQTDRIAQVIKPNGKNLGCNLGIIPYNFQRMIDQLQLKPLFTKKIV